MPSNHAHADTITKLINESHDVTNSDKFHVKKESTEVSKGTLEPSVNISDSALFGVTERTPTIGVRKPQPKRAGVIITLFYKFKKIMLVYRF